MSNFYGNQVKDANYVLRFALIAFMGIIATGSVLFWRSQLFLASEYQEMPLTAAQVKIKKENQARAKILDKKLIVKDPHSAD